MNQAKQHAIVVMDADDISALVEAAVRRAVTDEHRDDEWMTADEVARILGVKRETLRSILRRDGPPFYRPGKNFVFKRAEVVAWLEARAERPGARSSKLGRSIRALKGGRGE